MNCFNRQWALKGNWNPSESCVKGWGKDNNIWQSYLYISTKLGMSTIENKCVIIVLSFWLSPIYTFVHHLNKGVSGSIVGGASIKWHTFVSLIFLFNFSNYVQVSLWSSRPHVACLNRGIIFGKGPHYPRWISSFYGWPCTLTTTVQYLSWTF